MLEQYLMHLLTQSGRFGSWSSWSWGRIGSWGMERPKTDEYFSGTSCGQRHHLAAVPGWTWQFSLLQVLQAHVTRLGCCCCCWGPGIGEIILLWHRIPTGKHHSCEPVGLDLPCWWMLWEPGLVQWKLFGRITSTPLPGFGVGFPGCSYQSLPRCWLWDV